MQCGKRLCLPSHLFSHHTSTARKQKKISAFHFMDEECFGIYCTVATADGYYHFVLKKHISLSSVCEKKCFRCRDLIKLSHCADDDASIVWMWRKEAFLNHSGYANYQNQQKDDAQHSFNLPYTHCSKTWLHALDYELPHRCRGETWFFRSPEH